MECKTRGIVLKTVKYGDSKIIVDFLTREEGRISMVCKVSPSKRFGVRHQYFQPMTVLDIRYMRNPRQSLGTIKEAHIAMPYTSLYTDGIKMSITFFIAEFLHYTTRDLHTDAPLYDFIEQSMAWLDASERGVANFHLMFMIRMSLFLGFLPDMDSYREGALFDMREGIFCLSAPLHPDVLNAEDAKKMQILMRMTPSNLHLFPLSRNERNRIIDITLLYYHLHIPQFSDMKTLEVLRAL